MPLKIIHTADWHLGQTFFGYDRELEHSAFLTWLTHTIIERQTDVLLISGDVFDVANPSASAQRQFFNFLKEVNRQNPRLQVIIIAGNHDSAARLEAPAPLLEELNTSIIGIIRRTDEGEIDYDSLLIPLYDADNIRKGWCMAIPFLRQGDYPPSDEGQEGYIPGVNRMYRKAYASAKCKCKAGEFIVAMGHLHATGAELSENDRSERIIMGGLESVPADIFDKNIIYTALGHIHKAQRVGGKDNIRYAGSPIPMSFSETRYLHQVVSLTVSDNGNTTIESISIPRLVDLIRIPKAAAVPEEVLKQLNELPDKVNDDISTLPYLEVRVLMIEPEPGFRHQVEEIIKNKAVRLTSILPSYATQEKETDIPISTTDDLHKIDPMDMLKHAFYIRYKTDLPEDMEQLFAEVIQEINL